MKYLLSLLTVPLVAVTSLTAAFAHDDELSVSKLVNTGAQATEGQLVLIASGTHAGEKVRCTAYDARGWTVATSAVIAQNIATAIVLKGDMSTVTRYSCRVDP